MRFYLITTFLIFSLTAFSQKSILKEIDKYITIVNANPQLELKEYDWNEIMGSHNDHGAVLNIWKIENQIVKVEEQLYASYGRFTRLIYLKKNKPIKGIEIEEHFGYKNNEIDYSSLNVQFKMQVYVTGFNNLINEYQFEVEKEGKRIFNESYCDLNSVFAILDRINSL